ncbi:MAG: dTDP-4-amino-4,6-dideoxygalactose transaminase [Acidobacteria bacterium RIFCSPLOWO2_02_FULL_67_36]|nr:MAG: dTDP-4-amino-4,6-dideoxygalactose transaminase [Acidobacteria bacterium RIFCSPLOWO2_02_FULL_67_36]
MPYIPFNRPALAGRELEYIQQVVGTMHLAGDGVFTGRCHALLEQSLGAPKVLLTTSCTHALEMTALLLDIQPGDEVIVPSFTFVSTVNAFVLRGAKPVFADVRPDTLNLDETQLEGLITGRTRAIVVVHYAGVGCEMDTILSLATRRGIPVVEDNAHGLFGRYKGRPLGTFGDMATLSFHETKNITCGEGGALVLNNPARIARAEVLREKGTERSRFFRGEIDKYTWVDVGSSYLPSDILAAFLYAQLEAQEQIQARRRVLWNRYEQGLRDWAGERGIRLPVVPAECEQPFHLFYLLMPSLEQRQALIARLRSRDISAVFHYLPLHLSAMGRRLGGKPGDCPVTEDASDRLVRLPLSAGLTDAEQERVIAAVRAST